MASSSRGPPTLLQPVENNRNSQPSSMSQTSVTSTNETTGLFYQAVSEAALLQALQSTITGDGLTTTSSSASSSSSSEVTSTPIMTSLANNGDKQETSQGAGSQAALMNLLGNLSATQLLMVKICS